MKKTTDTKTKIEQIILKNMDTVMHESIMPYAEHVILERALPRVEDGLKPVQRRILYTMLELSLTPDKPHRKSARIVGDCLGKYHPHGDSSVYDAMVRMAQGFNMSLPLVDGHGNFGSVDGDSAAAMRYTEARMTPAAMQLLRDIDKDTVDYSWNFDDTLKEPDLLPGRCPNLLINGASGIAVGLATNIPPHNPDEAIAAVIARMDNPNISLDELMRIIPAPDFPTGGELVRSPEIRRAYETGRGKLTLRAKAHTEPMKNGKTAIVLTEIPYQVNKAALLEKVLAVTQEKKQLFSAVADIRDESDRSGTRAVIEVKKDGDVDMILAGLFKYTDMSVTFGVNLVAIAGGKPQQLSLIEILDCYIAHQRNVVTRRTRFELEAAKRREHILAGLMIAADNVDEVIRLIRASKTPKEAKERLMKAFSLSEVQAQAILDLRLQRLTNLELDLIRSEYADICKLIDRLNGILASPKKLDALIKKEMSEIASMFNIPRRTKLIDQTQQAELPQKLKPEAADVTVVLFDGLKARRLAGHGQSLEPYKAEGLLFAVEGTTDDDLKLFTDAGSLVSLKLSAIPETKPNSKPVNMASLIAFEKDESIIAAFAGEQEGDLLFATTDGMVKRTAALEYSVRVKRTPAIKLKEGEKLVSVLPCASDESGDLMLVTHKGVSIRFELATVPASGRVTGGVKCLKTISGDSVIYMDKASDEGELVVVSDLGFGKRSFLFDYPCQGRNGAGVKTIDFKKNGVNGSYLMFVSVVREPFDIEITQRLGDKTVISTEQLRIEQRASKGSLIVSCMPGDDVVNCKRV